MDVVTGAFGYIGRYIARHLLDSGREVRTITTHTAKPNPFGASVLAFPFNFDDPTRLTETLAGAETLYNTYWIRFPHDGQTFGSALRNTRTLFECAKAAGVKRIVHISVTNCSLDSRLPYYRGKARQEQMLAETGVPYCIVRPTLVFGDEDILVNNIAWLIRRFPVFPVFGNGGYRVQPVFVDDLAALAVAQSAAPPSVTLDAVGPDTFTFEEMVRLMAARLGRRTKFVHVPPGAGLLAGQAISLFLRDVLLTRNELRGLMEERLTSPQAPNCPTAFGDWLQDNSQTVGRRYTSELQRHFRWTPGDAI
jgi:NADH dehydrogenase